MPIIDVVRWDAQSNDEYAHRSPHTDLSTWTQLIVAESQEAVLIRSGQMEGPFGPGRHTLTTENLPILSKLINLPFGRSPFTADVWFTNRTMPLDVKWGTGDPIQLQDPKYNVMLPVRAFGQYGVQVDNTRKFLTKLVGTTSSFRRDHLVSYFRGLILTRAKDCIARTIVREKISVLEIAAHLNTISSTLQQEMAEGLEEFGLRIVNFFVNSITTPEDDPAVMRLKAALAKRAEMDILGFTYQQERSFDTMERAAGNEGAGMAPLMGAGIGIGMGAAMGVPMGAAMADVASQVRVAPPPPAVQAAAPPVSPVTPSPAVAPVAGAACPRCATASPPAARFCHGCGHALARACVSCSAALQDGARFCSSCGTAQP
jgi:membrane protease subunit (stomatin/prohibitin family)